MNPKLSPHQHESSGAGHVHHTQHPYWRRAHRDWRLWIAVAIMLLAMAIYLMTNDLAGYTQTQPQPPLTVQ